jgi:thymidine phosphorylase
MSFNNYNTVSLIRKKRDCQTLTEDEIEYLVRAYTDEVIPDYQMSAFLMASLSERVEHRRSCRTNSIDAAQRHCC